VATFRESASRKGIELKCETGWDVPDWGLGDPLRLQQVLVNLLSNALKFTEQGQVSVSVLRTTSAAGDQLRFEVSDTGPGIRTEDQKRVFAAFAQLEQNPAGAAGSGLGLTICRELVERMGGEVGVSSELGRGSKFFFSFPLEVAEPASASAAAPPAPPAARPWDNVPIRVLVAEDTEDNRLLISHYVRKEPVEIQFAADGQEAVDAIQAGSEFDLILMDLDMPRLDGYEATKCIHEWQRSHGRTATPIVALSAHAMREAELASMAAGCIAHIAKPVEQAMLLSTIRRYASATGVLRPEPAVLAEGVAALVPKYLAAKPQQIAEARASLAAKDYDPIRRFGHNLKGTGRGYGLAPIEDIGREIENAATNHDEGRIAEQLENLLRFVSSVPAAASK
jgi:CheY-like chemotaxis protein/anti-sigma regulatory factor (Ser/Thr protein kinase)